MIIKKFRVKNYKSIIDSGDCYLENDLTIFAGKNESGKSSILEALSDFNVNSEINSEVIPIDGDKDDLEISVTFIMPIEEVNTYFKKIDNNIKEANRPLEIEIKKNYYDSYLLSPEVEEYLQINKNYSKEIISIKDIISQRYGQISTLSFLYLADSGIKLPAIDVQGVDSSNIDLVILDLANYRKEYSEIDKKILSPDFDEASYSLLLETIQLNFKDIRKIIKLNDTRLKMVLDMVPNFVLFRSFEDNIPNSIPFDEIKESPFIHDFKLVSNLDINLILSKENRKIQKHKDTINVDLNKDYSVYWTQDNTQLKIEWDSNSLFFWVVEEGQWYEPNQRSKGKQWHISFYLRVSARTVEGKTNIILVDEPGLFLHASAQRDIYQRLLDSSRNSNVQIIFTTHSPYLFNSNELNRIRLIEKTNIEKGTTIINKVYSKADKETLTPILTAIGLELNQGIQNINQLNNVVVEGPGDLFYLNAFSKLVNNYDINFVYGGGSGNMGNVGTILSGWGCNVVYLYDNDKGHIDGAKNLVKIWYVKKDLIFTITELFGTIEDIFTVEEFNKFVLEENSKITMPISEYIKERNKSRETRIDKVLIARQFLSNVNKNTVNLSSTTLDKINKLFYRLSEIFSNLNKV